VINDLGGPEILFTPPIRGLAAKGRLAPVHEIFAFPNVKADAFKGSGGIAVVGALKKQDLGVADLDDVCDDHNISPLKFN
jgi:hypothetical protein